MFGVARDEYLPIALGRDHCRGIHCGDECPQIIAIIGFVGQHGACLQAFEQVRRNRDVAGLAGRDAKPHRATEDVSEHVDLGRQSTSGTPQRLVAAPPFPAAACWWTRTMVLSIMRLGVVAVGGERVEHPLPHAGMALAAETLVDRLPAAVAPG